MDKATFINGIKDKLPLLTLEELDKVREIIFESEGFKNYCKILEERDLDA